MPDLDAEIVVIGAGVVGLAVAAKMAPQHSVLVLERHDGIARETSSHNSGVVHAGIYYPTGSLKHRLCIEGNAAIWPWCAERAVPARRTGKLIVAFDESERAGLEEVHRQAIANAVPGIERIGGGRARALEPALHVADALFSPSTGVVDVFAYARSLEAAAREGGALMAFRHELRGGCRTGAGFELDVRDPDGERTRVRCAGVVNAAGLHAPSVATALGYPLDGDGSVPVLRQHLNRGRYYDVVNPALAKRFARPIYPLPDHHAGGLGLHLTVDTDGGAHLGPSMEWLDDEAAMDYHNDDAMREAFLHAGRRFFPELTEQDIAPGQVGYRPKLQAPGEGQADFLVWEDAGYVHLGGIESPGLTASLALAREVAERLRSV